MAKSGSFNTSAYDEYYLKFSWEQVSQSIPNNTTTISWKLTCVGKSDSFYYQARNIKLIIDGQTVYTFGGGYNNYIKLYDGAVVASGTSVFTHDDEGKRKFTASAEAGIYVWAVNCTGSDSFDLETILRASQPSLITWPETTNDVGYFGDTISIHMNRKSDKFTHTVRWEFGDKTGTIATGVTTGTTWTIPLEWINQLPASTSGSGRIYVDTYNGSTKIGTKYTGFTAKVAPSVRPTCTVQVLDNTDIQKTYGNLVQGLSKLYVKVNGYPAYSSPIAAYDVTANDVKYTRAEFVTDVLTYGDTVTVAAAVTDKRGRKSTSAEASFPVLNYSQPKVTALAVRRCNSDGTENDQGEYVEVLFSGEVTPLNNKNTAAYSVRYKKSTGTNWTELIEDVNGWKPSDLDNNFTVYNFALVFAADGNSSYDVEVSVTDNHHTASRATSVSTAFTLFNVHPSGTGWRFGGVAELADTLQNDLELRQVGNRYAFNSPGVAGRAGFIHMASIEITAANADTPITFIFSRRQALTDMKVTVQLRNADMAASSLSSIRYEGTNYGVFLVQASTLIWDLYVQKGSNYDTIALQDWYTSSTMAGRIKITFPGDLVDQVPTPYHRATPAVLQSILDAFMPVGYILTLYSHADPNTMYPGTTWVRITNRFLWACDASGEIGTVGGEKNHILTINELPVHTHGAVYSGNVEGTKTHAWLASGGSSMAYGTIEAGGDQAHNNMPPYIQVSIWRRTA